MTSLYRYLRKHGPGVERSIPVALFETYREHLTQTPQTIATGTSYRDDNRFYSLHVTDFRPAEKGIVGHVELFNPAYHPILHTLIDIPLLLCRNSEISMTEILRAIRKWLNG